MIVVLSPAKSLSMEVEIPSRSYTQPQLLDEAEVLVKRMKQFEPHELSSLMKISAKLGELNADRYQSWVRPFSEELTRPAMLAFQGDVYQGLDAASLDEAGLDFANEHVRILSGLYGLLKPLDLMHAYRLEMGTKLETERGKNLYEFWGDQITSLLSDQLAQNQSSALVNLASNEYFKSVKTSKLSVPVITPVFKDWKNDRYKIISFLAKKARGLMTRYIVDHRITDVEALKDFDVAGYRFDAEESSATDWIFKRRVD